MIGYTCGYLRYYYPVEFITAYLNSAANDDDLMMGTDLARQLGIRIVSPMYGYSRSKYYCDASSKKIYKGISSIKTASEKGASELALLYDDSYSSFVDLLAAIKNKTTVNSRMLDILIKIDFFADFGDISKLLWINTKFGDLYGKRSIKKDQLDKYGLSEDLIRKYSTAETPTHVDEIDIPAFLKSRGMTEEALADCVKIGYEKAPDGTRIRIEKGISFTKLFKKFEVTESEKARFATKTVYGKFDNVDICGLLKELFDNTEIKPCSVGDRIRYQQEMLGYIDYKNPELNPRFFVVGNLDTKYSPRFTAYCLANGKTVEMRVRKNRNYKNKADKTKTAFNQKPFRDGDILYLKSWGKEPKVTKTDDGWTKDYSVMYNWMYDYDIVEM